nr:MAG TPA: hypothetical protein [Caudoviricetes sp.]
MGIYKGGRCFIAATKKLQQRTKKSKAPPRSCTGARPAVPGFAFVNLHKRRSAARLSGSAGVVIISYNRNISGTSDHFPG